MWLLQHEIIVHLKKNKAQLHLLASPENILNKVSWIHFALKVREEEYSYTQEFE